MSQIQETPDAEIVPYEPGLPLAATLKATLGRFLPGAALGLVQYSLSSARFLVRGSGSKF